MMACARGAAPAVLTERAAEWTAAWVARRGGERAPRFDWPRIGEGKRLNEVLLPALLEMTAEHCAYCDGFPLDATGQPSIDHLRPKHLFPDRAFAWTNLYPACDRCQGKHGKGARWSEDALAPDAVDYRFDRFFRYVRATGHLEPNPQATPDDQRRAQATIDLFQLNGGGRPTDRRRTWGAYASYAERPYRFVFDDPW